MAETGWRRPFDDEIALPDGRVLRTLGDAGRYVTALPEKMQHRPEWQTAAEVLMLAAQGRAPLMFAHIGMLKALQASKPEAPPKPRRKAVKKYRIL
jgi:hypothetical protein